MEVLFVTDYLRVYLHPAPLVLEVEWLDFVSGDVFREAVQQLYHLTRQHDVRYWLANNTLMRAIRANDQAWLAALRPEWLELGLERVALVESEDAMNRMAMNGLLSGEHRTDRPIMCQFATLAAARAWLLAGPT